MIAYGLEGIGSYKREQWSLLLPHEIGMWRTHVAFSSLVTLLLDVFERRISFRTEIESSQIRAEREIFSCFS